MVLCNLVKWELFPIELNLLLKYLFVVANMTCVKIFCCKL